MPKDRTGMVLAASMGPRLHNRGISGNLDTYTHTAFVLQWGRGFIVAESTNMLTVLLSKNPVSLPERRPFAAT